MNIITQMLSGAYGIKEKIVHCDDQSIPKLGVQEELGNEREALAIVKLDPAVLEARVRNAKYVGEYNQLNHRQYSTTSEVSFEQMLRKDQASLLSLTPAQYQLLLEYVATLRRQRLTNQMNLECGFCKKSGKPVSWYSTHGLRNWRGRVTCPVLRTLRCPRCGATGDQAHTANYCQQISNQYHHYGTRSRSTFLSH